MFRSETDKDDDVLFRLRPGVRIYEDRGDDLNFSAGYEAPVEFSVDNSDELDDVDHIGTGNFQYHVNDRVEIFGSEQYGYLRSTLRQPDVNTQAEALDPGTLEFNDQRDRVKTNDASLGASYAFSPRTVGRLIAGSSFFDSTRSDRAQGVVGVRHRRRAVQAHAQAPDRSRRRLRVPGLRRPHRTSRAARRAPTASSGAGAG